MKKAMLFVFLLPLFGTAQNITFDWLNQPCASTLSCDSGCTACNLPVNTGTQFIGNNVGFLGVDICPHPIVIGDNALLTYGWPAIADTAHMVIVTGLAFTPTRIDSIIIRHRGGSDGPQRVLVKFGVNVSLPQNVIADIYMPELIKATSLRSVKVPSLLLRYRPTRPRLALPTAKSTQPSPSTSAHAAPIELVSALGRLEKLINWKLPPPRLR